MKTDIHFLSLLVQFFLELEMFQKTSCTENQNTHFMFNNFFPPEIRAFYVIMWKKYCTPRQATDDNRAHAHCMLDT